MQWLSQPSYGNRTGEEHNILHTFSAGTAYGDYAPTENLLPQSRPFVMKRDQETAGSELQKLEQETSVCVSPRAEQLLVQRSLPAEPE
jgi:hypothetical protein